jgi:hypothetical protein
MITGYIPEIKEWLNQCHTKMVADDIDRVFLIYSQKIDPLGNKVKTDKVKDRTIHWVPSIQI